MSHAVEPEVHDEQSPRRLGLVPRLVLVGAIGAVTAGVVGGLSLANQVQYDAKLRDIDGIRQAAITSSVLGRTGSDLRGYQTAVAWDVNRSGPGAAFADNAANLQGLTAATGAVKAGLGKLPVGVLTGDEKAHFDASKAAWDQFFAANDQAMTGYKAGDVPGRKASDSVVAGPAATAYATAQTEMAAVNKSVNGRVAGINGEAASAAGTYRTLQIIALLLGLLAIAAVTWLTARTLRRDLGEMREALSALADGDLTREADVPDGDEFGEMAALLREAQQRLRALVSGVASATRSVSESGRTLTETAGRVGSDADTSSGRLDRASQSAEDVSRNIQTVAAGTEEMTASIQEISRSANDAAAVAASAVTVADRTNETVSKLGESSVEIGNVVKTITSIAEQTNLLALNATIEAARAGEAGKGFAVVANEVKDLAQETSKATEDIGRRVEAIQLDTEAAVAAIGEIASIIAQINDSQATIASAVEEQTATTNEMGRNVSDAAGGAGRIATDLREASAVAGSSNSTARSTADAAQGLAGQARELESLVGRFRY